MGIGVHIGLREAIQIIHPKTTAKALSEYRYKKEVIQSVDEASETVCDAARHRIDLKPIARIENGLETYYCRNCGEPITKLYKPYCTECGQGIKWYRRVQ